MHWAHSVLQAGPTRVKRSAATKDDPDVLAEGHRADQSFLLPRSVMTTRMLFRIMVMFAVVMVMVGVR